ncbi:MAG: hypothetical protein QNJ35_09090 [Paracoccaceae bacterium]|nr:hypothetical protein [Paracoccaceae bacterium]
MGNRAVHPEDSEEEVFDLSNDAHWQARLAEARARREIALKKKALEGIPAKNRVKPWEEEGAVVIDEEAFSKAPPRGRSGIDFFDRMDAIRKFNKTAKTDQEPEPETQPVPEPEIDVLTSYLDERRNWYEDAEDLPHESEPQEPEERPARETQIVEDRETKPNAANSVFDDPAFVPDSWDNPTLHSHAALYRLREAPPPKSAAPTEWETRQRLIEEEETARVAPPEVEIETAPRSKGWSRLAVAGFLLAAVAVGPLYHMSRPLDRGPLVYFSPDFGLVPALELPVPMFEVPVATVSGEWTPVSLGAPAGPIAAPRPGVPDRLAEVASWAVLPLFGASVSGIETGARIAPVTISRTARRGVPWLPTVVPEAELDGNGVAKGLGQTLTAETLPLPRPIF